MDYLNGLNDRQREAVLHTDGPLLILAGAGSGKTRVVTHKIAYLIEEKRIFPGNILAITFTNKAANEMKERVAKLLSNPVEDMWMGTFHSICVRMLRRDIDKIGYNRSFTIYDRDDQITLIKECIKEKNISKEMYKESSVLAQISKLKDAMTDPDVFINQNYKDFYLRNIGELYALYQKKLKQYNALDFDDLIIKAVQLLKSNADILDYYQRKFKYVFVDEYQDTNKIQYELVKLLSDRYKNICVVGDGDQCIIEGMKVNTPNGEVKIEELEEKNEVYSAGGCGKVMTGTIDAIMKKKYHGAIVNIKTENGKELKLTPNHIMFSKLNPDPGSFYIYLMYKKELGYTIGQTQGFRSNAKEEIKNGLAVKINQENGDKAWILRVCKSKEEATYYETLYSTKYGIPTIAFHIRGRKTSLTQEAINNLFNEIDTRHNVIKLMDDLLIFEEYPHIRPGVGVRENTFREIVNLTYFGGKVTDVDSGWHTHRINFNTSRDEIREKTIENQFNTRKGQRNTWRIETERKDYDEAYKLATEIIALEEDIEISKRARLSKDVTFDFMPASHIKPSMSVAIYNNGEITEEIVSEVSIEEYDGYVYDLSIPNLRQFICEGIVVHNSIYGWRGADITNILNFEKDFQRSTTIMLEQNYRSTQNILNVANKVIKNNDSRKDKKLWTSNHKGDPIIYNELPDAEDETLFVADKIDELIKEGYKLSDFAILYRTNAQSRSFEDVFIRKAIPYKIVGGLRFYDRMEIKDIIAYLKVLENPVDNISLKRIINTPRRGIGNATIEKIEQYALEINDSMYGALLSLDNIDLNARAKNSLKPFVEMMNNLMAKKELLGVKDFIEEVINATGYIKVLEKEDTIESQTRLDNIKEFLSVAIDFEIQMGESNLEEFLATIALLSDVDKTSDTTNVVTMMTVHSAKGLEFPVVFMVGMEEELFPTFRALDNESDLEEERRLCYVAITRAEKLLFITSAKLRTIYGKTNYTLPSRFIGEMGDAIEKQEKERENYIEREKLINIQDYTTKKQNDYRTKKDSFNTRPFVVQGTQRPKPTGNPIDINVGDKVRHKKWGIGTVVMIKNRDNDKEVAIAFDSEGIKRLLLSIAPIEIVR